MFDTSFRDGKSNARCAAKDEDALPLELVDELVGRCRHASIKRREKIKCRLESI